MLSCAAIALCSPAPKDAYAKVAGIIPSAVAATKGASPTPASAGTKLTSQNGNNGTSRKKTRYQTASLRKPATSLSPSGPARGTQRQPTTQPSANLVIRKIAVAPRVAAVTAARPPAKVPKIAPPLTVRSAAPGTDSATADA